ncbi:RNA methyltransferase, partial [Frankia sp. Cpl3]|nr:RNA methyltransferase [Frankia sp. Cpl3]
MAGRETITSLQNPQIKRLQQLLERKGREASQTFLVEGVHLVEEALLSDSDVLTLVYDMERGIDSVCERALQTRGEQGIRLIAASAAVMAKLSETKSPQGIVAEVTQRKHVWEDWLEQQKEQNFLVLLLDELQDPGNLGTIMRTAEAAGVDALVLGNGSVDLYNGKVVRSTMGALFRLPIFVTSLETAVQQLKEIGSRILVTTLSGQSVAYDEADYQGSVGIVIGNEARGVSSQLIAKASQSVHIPLYGKAESLNAAVAAGIMVYEARRQ